MPFSCCTALRNMMVKSCRRTLRSARSSQGFLAWTPTKLFFSFCISSCSLSQSAAPCSCFSAAHRKKKKIVIGVICILIISPMWSGYRVCCIKRFPASNQLLSTSLWRYQNMITCLYSQPWTFLPLVIPGKVKPQAFYSSTQQQMIKMTQG